jgi:RNA polymerase sigma-54 factor
MQLSQSTSMRMDQRQVLTPRMIQSMEILQLPLMALEERIEQELQSNPVLEFREGESEPEVINDAPEATRELAEGERALVVKENSDQAEDFERLQQFSPGLQL